MYWEKKGAAATSDFLTNPYCPRSISYACNGDLLPWGEIRSFIQMLKAYSILQLCELFLTDYTHVKGTELHWVILLLCVAFLLGQWP